MPVENEPQGTQFTQQEFLLDPLEDLRSQIQRRLISSGGRATDPEWSISRHLPMSPDTWEQLKELARKLSGPRNLSPGQVGSHLLEEAIKSYLPEELEGDTDHA